MPRTSSEFTRSGDPDRARRQFEIVGLLHAYPGHGFSIREIVEKLYPGQAHEATDKRFQANYKNVQRDLEALTSAHRAVVLPHKRLKRFSAPPSNSGLSELELLIFHAAARLLYHRASSSKDAYEKVLKKLCEHLPGHVQPLLQRSFEGLGRRRDSAEGLLLEKVAHAWCHRHPVQFMYVASGGSGQARSNTVEPYLIEVHPWNLELYLIGLETSYHRQVRTFKLSRMQQLRVLEGKYQIGDFDAAAFFRDAWGIFGSGDGPTEHLDLRFQPEAVPRIREGGYRFAIPNKDHINPDGTLDITVTAPADPRMGFPRELLGWVLSFGPRVEVLGPPHLRDFWLTELRRAYELATRVKE